MNTKLYSFWMKRRKTIITVIIIIAAAWLLGQIAVPALMKEIFLGGHIA